MYSKTFILLVIGVAAHVKTLCGAPAFKAATETAVSPLCKPPRYKCYFPPEDTCYNDNDCRSGRLFTGICCPHQCRPDKVCQYVRKQVTTEQTPTIQTTVPTTEKFITTDEPNSTEEPSTIEESSTSDKYITTEEYVTTTKVPPTTEELPTTELTTNTQIPTTSQEPSTTMKPTTAQLPSNSPLSTINHDLSTEEPTTTHERTTTQVPRTTQVPTTTTNPPTTKLPTTKLPTTKLPPTTTQLPTTKHIPTTTKVPPLKPTPDNICRSTEQKNILFLVDGTAHSRLYPDIIKQEFGLLKSYIKNVILRLENQNFMVGLMQFGGRYAPRMEVDFTKTTDMSWLLRRVDAIKQVKGSIRKTGEALEVASNEFYKVKYVNDRYNSNDVIILITRGIGFDKLRTDREVKMLRKKSVKIMSVGIGRRSYLERHLYDVSSTIKDVHIAKYRNLGSIEDSVVRGICSTFAKAGSRSLCGKQRNDIYFVIDGSASIDHSNFDKKRNFLVDLLYLLETPKSELHIGMMQFSEVSLTRELLKLGKHSIDEEERLVRQMEYDHGRYTMLGDALDRFNKTVFNGYGGDRSDAKNILVIFSDGRAHDLRRALELAESIKRKGVRIITLTVLHNAWTHALNQMASERRYSVRVKLEDPTYYAQKLAALICPSYKKKL